jgi:Raf kinase inhibitor-like YbhB/YbcL family protein
MPARTRRKQSNKALLIELVESRTAAPVTMASPSFADGAEIPDANSDYGDGLSPELRWSGVPGGTRSLALVTEDPDAPKGPFTHWILYNLPGDLRELPPSIPSNAELPQLAGALQGRTSAGSIGYFGPHPPENDPPHHYHFELFCLDAPLPLGPGADRDQLRTALSGHVLAKGELVGTYEAPVAGG